MYINIEMEYKAFWKTDSDKNKKNVYKRVILFVISHRWNILYMDI